MPDRVKCRVFISWYRYQNITSTEVVRFPVSEINVHHVVLGVYYDVPAQQDLVGVELCSLRDSTGLS